MTAATTSAARYEICGAHVGHISDTCRQMADTSRTHVAHAEANGAIDPTWATHVQIMLSLECKAHSCDEVAPGPRENTILTTGKAKKMTFLKYTTFIVYAPFLQ